MGSSDKYQQENECYNEYEMNDEEQNEIEEMEQIPQ